jgi:hypothetical protein
MGWIKYAGAEGYETQIRYLGPQELKYMGDYAHFNGSAGIHQLRRVPKPEDKEERFHMQFSYGGTPGCCGAAYWSSFSYVNTWAYIDKTEFNGNMATERDAEVIKKWLSEKLNMQHVMAFGILIDDGFMTQIIELGGAGALSHNTAWKRIADSVRSVGRVIATFKNPNTHRTLEYMAFNPQDHGRTKFDFEFKYGDANKQA